MQFVTFLDRFKANPDPALLADEPVLISSRPGRWRLRRCLCKHLPPPTSAKSTTCRLLSWVNHQLPQNARLPMVRGQVPQHQKPSCCKTAPPSSGSATSSSPPTPLSAPEPHFPMSDDPIKAINVAEELSKSFLEYSMSVIISRAFPDVRDGLKPSQRRILYAMRQLASAPEKRTSSAPRLSVKRWVTTTRTATGHLSVARQHGPAMVDTRNAHRRPGNFGSVEGDPPASMRYTEARSTARHGDDGRPRQGHGRFHPELRRRQTEPTVLPSAFPNLLVNGGTGIAVGMATNLARTTSARSSMASAPRSTIRKYVARADGAHQGAGFPVCCEIRGIRGIEEYFRTGRGSMRMRGRMEVEENDNGKVDHHHP